MAMLASSRLINTCEFLAHVRRLADQLPAQRYALNLCGNRYHFLVTFCAVIVRGQTNLLPANRGIAVQQQLCDRYPGSYVLHDGCDVANGINTFEIIDLADYFAGTMAATGESPQIPLHHIAAIAFTSGSTGQPKPVEKSWQTFCESSLINARHMLADAVATQHLLATVPGQHMWGLETSILLPLFADICSSAGQPLFPKDVQTALQQLAAPRVLVSSPVHLRALAHSGLQYPPVERILSATAPLDAALATQVERLFDGRLVEIYGSSESGSMAYRHTAEHQQWTLFDGMQLEQRDNTSFVHASHLPGAVELQDTLLDHGNRQMTLRGRQTDMINVAGKRGSLQELNRVLLSAANVIDGVVFRRADAATASARGDRLAALVVAEQADAQTLNVHFRRHVDAAFVPRPIYFVNTLPREENGKLPLNNVLEAFERVRRQPTGRLSRRNDER